MQQFKDILHTPTFVLNVDSKSDRWKKTKFRLDEVGFMNYQRWQCADGRNKESILNVWDELGLKNIKFNPLGFNWSGSLAGSLSWLACLKHAIDRKFPYVLLLEDDIQFHPDFLSYGDYLFNGTPKDFDLIYVGSQTEYRPDCDISVGQVYGGWSMLFSLGGAKKVYDYLLNKVYEGTFNCIDMELYQFQYDSFQEHTDKYNFNFYVWSTRHNDYRNVNPDNWEHGFWDGTTDPFGWEWKWDGVIFPDPNIPSTLSCGCVDPRRLETRMDIKEKICEDPSRCSSEAFLQMKKDLGFELYS